MDGDEAMAVAVEETMGVVVRDEIAHVEDADAETTGGETEVGKGFLAFGVDFEEDDVFGVVVVENDLREGAREGGFGVAAEEAAERGIEVVGIAVGFGEQGHEGVDGWEGLQLDEHGLHRTIGGTDEAEVSGHEVRMRSFAGDAAALGNDGGGCGEVVRVGEQRVSDLDADVSHGTEQIHGEEDGRLRDAKADASMSDVAEMIEEASVVLGTEARVEGVTQSREHEDKDNWRGCFSRGGALDGGFHAGG